MTTLPAKYEAALIQGDLGKLSEAERLSYYKGVCDSLGLNPTTKPFQYIVLNNRLTLYATKDCTEQLRKVHGVSITHLEGSQINDLYIVRATAKDKEGRTDCATGVVATGKLYGDNLANAIMKAETKAKRRVTLSICGLGMLDESETDSIPGAKIVNVENPDVSGEIGLIESGVVKTGAELAEERWYKYTCVKFNDKDDFKKAAKIEGAQIKFADKCWFANMPSCGMFTSDEALDGLIDDDRNNGLLEAQDNPQ